jgi:hypothetical protein
MCTWIVTSKWQQSTLVLLAAIVVCYEIVEVLLLTFNDSTATMMIGRGPDGNASVNLVNTSPSTPAVHYPVPDWPPLVAPLTNKTILALFMPDAQWNM